jgi:hypothetical protein
MRAIGYSGNRPSPVGAACTTIGTRAPPTTASTMSVSFE